MRQHVQAKEVLSCEARGSNPEIAPLSASHISGYALLITEDDGLEVGEQLAVTSGVLGLVILAGFRSNARQPSAALLHLLGRTSIATSFFSAAHDE